MSDDQAREMRPETTSEHIARDMREGRFPEQSERQMVPVLASLPHEIQVWRSMDALDHTGTWSTTRYPAEAVTYVSKADAQAAVALMVAQAATQADPWDGPVTKNKIVDAQAITAQQIKARIRALAPASGLAAVKALRVEARENAMQALASMGQAQEAYEAQLEAEAELARVKADAAAAQALMVERAAEAVKSLCDNDEWNLALHEALSAIRALAPADGHRRRSRPVPDSAADHRSPPGPSARPAVHNAEGPAPRAVSAGAAACEETMTEAHLLPCPFCGGEAHIDGTTWRPSDGEEVAWVVCKLCNAYGPTFPVKEAIAAWNRRAALATQEAGTC